MESARGFSGGGGRHVAVHPVHRDRLRTEGAERNDERADPLKQTRVAAAFLRDLYTMIGDRALAMAAYNSGEPRVMGAIARNGRAKFWALYDREL
jgi:Transglycosylase SLT domain